MHIPLSPGHSISSPTVPDATPIQPCVYDRTSLHWSSCDGSMDGPGCGGS